MRIGAKIQISLHLPILTHNIMSLSILPIFHFIRGYLIPLLPYLIGHETGLHHVLQGGEALLDGRGDGPEDQDQGQVHVSQ